MLNGAGGAAWRGKSFPHGLLDGLEATEEDAGTEEGPSIPEVVVVVVGAMSWNEDMGERQYKSP